MEVNEVSVTGILNPTSIDLGEYVINPYMGCAYGCLYCYVRSNKAVRRRTAKWGRFIDVRLNAADLLKAELDEKDPRTVLLGSTTECFQPLETRYGLTGRVLELLNRRGVYYIILTRSPLILRYLSLLKKGYCRRIYFTVNTYNDALKRRLEPKSPAFKRRGQAVRRLLKEGIPVVPCFSPFLPWVSDIRTIFEEYGNAPVLEIEALNLSLPNTDRIVAGITGVFPETGPQYARLLNDRQFYYRTWEEVKQGVLRRAGGRKVNVHTHGFSAYFNNRYESKTDEAF